MIINLFFHILFSLHAILHRPITDCSLSGKQTCHLLSGKMVCAVFIINFNINKSFTVDCQVPPHVSNDFLFFYKKEFWVNFRYTFTGSLGSLALTHATKMSSKLKLNYIDGVRKCSSLLKSNFTLIT